MKLKLRKYLCALVLLSILLLNFQQTSYARTSAAQTDQIVHVPYWAPGAPYPSRSIFWMGKVDAVNNYADIRMVFDDDLIKVEVHVIDRLLWFDPNQIASNLTQWDSVSVYLNTNGNTGTTPSSSAYRFDIQLSSNQRATYRGNGTSWAPANIPITAYTEWRGIEGPNSGKDDKGWVAYYQIPFSSLGFNSHPSIDSIWGLGVILHDRDSLNGSSFQEVFWPDALNPDVPSSWGKLSFGWAHYNAPEALPQGSVVIQGGINGANVIDADVGGHTTCGDTYGPEYWSGWGSANYAGISQINIQNQWDISDWPCFSKYFVTMPLSAIPPGKKIISATYTMYLFGTAGGGEYGSPPDSYIQAFSIGDDWSESSINWNNAPRAMENLSGTWVHPVSTSDWIPYRWDVSIAVAKAYNAGQPLRLAFYSADGDYHTGKYFISNDWSESKGHPFVTITYGDICGSQVTCHFSYIPLTMRK